MIPYESCTQELRCSDTVTDSTINCPTVGDTECGWLLNKGGVWLYSISYVDARVAVSLCDGDPKNWFDTIIELYQDSVEGICVGINDDRDSCFNNQLSLITFDAVETDKHIVLVAGYSGSEGKFTLSVECDHPSLEPTKDPSG